uniref:Uncharacterized protein n=1 Tax=Anguilla anguilla TaxID=7936 RepID=A0A0E9RI14_ANGAN
MKMSISPFPGEHARLSRWPLVTIRGVSSRLVWFLLWRWQILFHVARNSGSD